MTCQQKWINCTFEGEILVLRQNWGNLLNIGKDPGVSRFEFAIGLFVEASAESYIIFLIILKKNRNYWKKWWTDMKYIQIRNLPPPPKKGRKILILRDQNWKPSKYWQKIKKYRFECIFDFSILCYCPWFWTSEIFIF